MRKVLVAFAVMSLVLVGCGCNKCGSNPVDLVKMPLKVVKPVTDVSTDIVMMPVKVAKPLFKSNGCNKCQKQEKAPRCSTCKAGKIRKVKTPCNARCDDCQIQSMAFCSDCYNNGALDAAELAKSMPLGTKKVVMVEREVPVQKEVAKPAAPAVKK